MISTEVSGIKEQLGENSEYGIITENSIDGLYEGLKQICHQKIFAKYQEKARDLSDRYNLQDQMNLIYDVINNS